MYIKYNTQEEIASKISKILKIIDPNMRKTQLNVIPYIIFGMINSESSVTGDIAKVLKDDFSKIHYDSITRRIRRLFNNKHFNAYDFYDKIIKYVISHHDNNIHISFDHMYSKENYTVLLFSMRIGKQGIPIHFRTFAGIKNPDAYLDDTICESIKIVSSYFDGMNCNLIFSADRWFNSEKILSTIDSLGHTYTIRFKGNIKIKVFDSKEGHYIYKYSGELKGLKHQGKYYTDVYLYDNSSLKTNVAISKSDSIDEPWIIISNQNISRAIRNYSYRFGNIECVFKNQKSNGFYIEKICNATLKGFTSMYALVCFCVLYLTILGTDYSKNTRCYRNDKIRTHTTTHGKKVRIVSLFNTGLILFNLAFNSSKYIRLPFSLKLYDI